MSRCREILKSWLFPLCLVVALSLSLSACGVGTSSSSPPLDGEGSIRAQDRVLTDRQVGVDRDTSLLTEGEIIGIPTKPEAVITCSDSLSCFIVPQDSEPNGGRDFDDESRIVSLNVGSFFPRFEKGNARLDITFPKAGQISVFGDGIAFKVDISAELTTGNEVKWIFDNPRLSPSVAAEGFLQEQRNAYLTSIKDIEAIDKREIFFDVEELESVGSLARFILKYDEPQGNFLEKHVKSIRGLSLPDRGFVFFVDGPSLSSDPSRIKLFDHYSVVDDGPEGLHLIGERSLEIKATVSTSPDIWRTKSHLPSYSNFPVGSLTYGGHRGEPEQDKAVVLGYVVKPTADNGDTGPSVNVHDEVSFQIRYTKSNRRYSLALEKMYFDENFNSTNPAVRWYPGDSTSWLGSLRKSGSQVVTIEPSIFYHGTYPISLDTFREKSYLAGVFEAQDKTSTKGEVYKGIFVLLPQR